MNTEAKTLFSVVALLCLAFSTSDIENSLIPLNEIKSGGPPKDGIPALIDPKFLLLEEAPYLEDESRVLGVSMGGEAKAYPLAILNWHELVNDVVGGKDILVSYCPLCGTGMVFDAQVDGKRMLFGVSGKLYNSDVLMYDRETESLWSQIMMKAVTGPMTGEVLKLLAAEHTTWKDWRTRHPHTKVLSDDTGYRRDYGRNPYVDYAKTSRLFFPVSHEDGRLDRKAWVVGIVINREAKAYPFLRLEKTVHSVKDVVGGRAITVHYDSVNRSAVVKDSAGAVLPSVQAYWFAWAAFHPETALYK